jgi:hypothetical protein
MFFKGLEFSRGGCGKAHMCSITPHGAAGEPSLGSKRSLAPGGPASQNWVVENEMATRNVIERETVLFQELDNDARLNGGQFGCTRGPKK